MTEPASEGSASEDSASENSASGNSAPGEKYRPSSSQWILVGAIIAFGVGFVLYRWFKHDGDLGQSSALYVGIPLVLAIILALSAPPKRAAGTALKVTTLLLLLSVPVLGEGAICVLLAAPIFYFFVFLGAKSVEMWRERDRGTPPGARLFLAPALLAMFALEGTTPALSVPGDAASSSAVRVIDLPAGEVSAALAKPMTFDPVNLTGILRLGFPDPRSDSGGLDIGDVRTIEFDGAGHRHGPTAQHHWGTGAKELKLKVTGRTDRSVTFVPVSDTTPLSSWLRWDRIDVTWAPVDADRTELRWSFDYTRLLSPSWYFGPIERFVTGRAADYLIRSVDTGPAPIESTVHTH